MRILRYSTQLRLMITGSSLARTIRSHMRTFSNKTFTLSMRYINEEVHEPPRVNEEKSQSLSDGKAKGARAFLVTIKRGPVPARNAKKSAGEKIVTIPRRLRSRGCR